ncbi:hypothetical protein HY478_02340, partial [Candidatus Uhrbacteria bacterium]|nr:hypothetical protein [Candidatus Uhrbacteria bacterium]
LYKYYAAAATYEDAQRASEQSASEGTRIHELVQAHWLGEKPDVGSAVEPAVTAALAFAAERGIKVFPQFIEKRIASQRHRYAGTIDALAQIDGRFGVLDIKTSQGIYRDYGLQISAYVDALTPYIKDLSTAWILRIDQQQTCRRCSATLRTKGGNGRIKTNGSASLPCPDKSHDWAEPRGVVELKEFPFWRDDFQAFLAAKKLWEWENSFWLRRVGYTT